MLFTLLLVSGCECRNRPPGGSVNTTVNDRSELLAQVATYQSTGELSKAVDTLRKMLVADARDYEAMFLLANVRATQGHEVEAIELLAEIPADHPEAGIPALEVAADLCVKIARYENAEQRYQKLLQLNPSINAARRKLAFSHNCQGRRHEAVMLIRELCPF